MRFTQLSFLVVFISKISFSQAVAKIQLHHYLSPSEKWTLKLDTSNNFVFTSQIKNFELAGKYTLTDSTIQFKCDSNYIKAYSKYFSEGSITKSKNVMNIFYGIDMKRIGNYLIPDVQLKQKELGFKLNSDVFGTYYFTSELEGFSVHIDKNKTYYIEQFSCVKVNDMKSKEKGTWKKEGNLILLKHKKHSQDIIHRSNLLENELFFAPYFLVAKQPWEFDNNRQNEDIQEMYNYILKSNN